MVTELSVCNRGARTARLAIAALLATGASACKPASPPPAAAEATPAAASMAPAPASGLMAHADQAAQAITADVLRAPIATLGSDEFQGRGPGTPADPKTRAYLVEQMKQLGLQPAATGGQWMQPFTMVGVQAQPPATWTFGAGAGAGKQVTFKRRDDFVAMAGLPQPQSSLKDAEVVFVGYGIQAPEFQWDDFKGQDLKGKVLLMLNNDPDWDPSLFGGVRRLYYGRWTYKYESAARQGAAGAIIIHTTPSAGYPYQVVQTSWSGEKFELPSEGEPRVQVRGWLTEDATRRLVELGGRKLDDLVQAAKSRDFQPVPLGVRTSLTVKNKVRRVETANVLGKIPGGDPLIGDQVVLFTAHHDHLGVGDPDKEGDKIYNGALDNASGCAQLLAIARAFKALPQAPRRTIVFGFVAAEEQGLLGSEYLGQHPPVPAGKIAADMNFDGGNIWGRTNDITYVGMEKSNLADVVQRFAAEQRRTVKPDQFPDRGFYYRSDQFSLAKVGVPAIYLETGTDFVGRPAGWGKEQIEKWEAEHYHQPSDELTPDWNFDGMVDDARLGFKCGLWIAEEENLPAWTPGDEFEATRKAAIAAAQGGATAAASPQPSASPAGTANQLPTPAPTATPVDTDD
ncbi:MAG TPA: M28 family metallopeptidase [Thermoanaerobaculia bacterium]|jgi:Zn-dependent M28 family amino/carboxypeptidase|nr:M28 family metallopeptidase [Thermoanaerobaculia bacterium]